MLTKPVRGSKFNYAWCEKFAWLYYDEEKGKAFCKYCVKAHKINKLTEGVDNFARVTGNKGTWASHDKSSGHKEALHAYEVRPNVLHKLQATGVLEAVRGRRALLSLLDIVRTCLRQNIPMRGHSHTEGNFHQLLGYLLARKTT